MIHQTHLTPNISWWFDAGEYRLGIWGLNIVSRLFDSTQWRSAIANLGAPARWLMCVSPCAPFPAKDESIDNNIGPISHLLFFYTSFSDVYIFKISKGRPMQLMSPRMARYTGIDSHQHQNDSWHIWRHLRKDIVSSCDLFWWLIFLHGCSRTYRVALPCVLGRWAGGPVGRTYFV